MIINVDLDGVGYDFNGEFQNYAIYKRGYDEEQVGVEPTKWEVWEDYGISHGEWRKLFRDGVKDKQIWWKGEPIEGAREALWRLSDGGHYIRILTTRLVHSWGHTDAAIATATWLEENNIPYRSLAMIGPGDSKFNYVADFSIDDNHDNVKGNPRGFLFHQPWNKDINCWLRVKDWEEFEWQVESMIRTAQIRAKI